MSFVTLSFKSDTLKNGPVQNVDTRRVKISKLSLWPDQVSKVDLFDVPDELRLLLAEEKHIEKHERIIMVESLRHVYHCVYGEHFVQVLYELVHFNQLVLHTVNTLLVI